MLDWLLMTQAKLPAVDTIQTQRNKFVTTAKNKTTVVQVTQHQWQPWMISVILITSLFKENLHVDLNYTCWWNLQWQHTTTLRCIHLLARQCGLPGASIQSYNKWKNHVKKKKSHQSPRLNTKMWFTKLAGHYRQPMYTNLHIGTTLYTSFSLTAVFPCSS